VDIIEQLLHTMAGAGIPQTDAAKGCKTTCPLFLSKKPALRQGLLVWLR